MRSKMLYFIIWYVYFVKKCLSFDKVIFRMVEESFMVLFFLKGLIFMTMVIVFDRGLVKFL